MISKCGRYRQHGEASPFAAQRQRGLRVRWLQAARATRREGAPARDAPRRRSAIEQSATWQQLHDRLGDQVGGRLRINARRELVGGAGGS
ncbi:hypothetical protein C3488_12435 [Streptomyces sp. Ru72]|nr:hypothetical protein C3488_12435 [Streptomyces sp. Ru72]